MSTCVEKLPHKCGSGDGLQVFSNEDGKYTGYCFACDTFEADPYGDKPEGYKPKVNKKSPEQIAQELADITDYPTVALPERKLKQASLAYFGIKIGVSEADGETPVTHHYPYYKDGELKAYKTRLIADKRMWSVGDLKEVDMFGWDQAVAAGGKKLFITEGELDAVALFQIFQDQNAGSKYADYLPAIVSVPNGAGGASKTIGKALTEIKKHWKEIVLCFDNDAAGKKAVLDVLKVVPDALVATLPGKDANDCLIKGKSKKAYQAVVFNSAAPKNTRLVTGTELHELGKEPPKYGFSWPWETVTKATKGMRLGETIYIGAGAKMGKSELVNQIAAHCITEHGWKVFLCKPEEANVKTYKLVAGKIEGKRFNDPDVEFDEEAYERAGEKLEGNLFMLNLYQHVGWETLKADIRSAVQEGCKAIIIDPVTNLTNGMTASAANERLQEIAQELSALALDLNVIIFIFCHLRNPDAGPPHERGGEVLSSQFAGSRAMARSCNLMFGLEGDKDPNKPELDRNVRNLVLLEDRENGEVGRFPMYWDKNTTLFNEIR